MKRTLLVALLVSAAACGGKKDNGGAGSGSGSAAPAGSGSGSAKATGSGSAGSAAAGSGSAGSAAGSGSGTGSGSGSAMASGSGAGSGSGSAAGSGDGSGSAAGSGSGSGSAAAEEHPKNPNHIKSSLTGDKTFEQLSAEEQGKFMKDEVMPLMKKEFQEFDGKKFANFGCKTCHGKDAKEKKFKMPNPELPKLDFVALRAGKQEPKMAEFMAKHTSPDMAALLNLEPYQTKVKEDGFGCLHCHEMKK